jgi:hypothetical protein
MDDENLFGPVAHDYPLGKAISDGVVAPYRILCIDIHDRMLHELDRRGLDERSVEYRGARLAALQTAVLTAAAECDLGRVLSFHHRVAEARTMSTGLLVQTGRAHAQVSCNGVREEDRLLGQPAPRRRSSRTGKP